MVAQLYDGSAHHPHPHPQPSIEMTQSKNMHVSLTGKYELSTLTD